LLLKRRYISEWVGRRIAVYTVMVILTVAAIVEVTATQWYAWMGGKLVAGIGIGAIQATLPVVSVDLLG
jgi:cyanate permease